MRLETSKQDHLLSPRRYLEKKGGEFWALDDFLPTAGPNVRAWERGGVGDASAGGASCLGLCFVGRGGDRGEVVRQEWSGE